MFVFSVRPGWDDAGVDRDRLKVYLEQGLSLIQIGALENRDPSTVGYWVRKHGLEANGAGRHAPKGAIDRDLLAELVSEGLRLREIAGEVGRSISTVRYWIGKHGLDAPKAARREAVERALAEGRRTLRRECKRHGVTTFVIENSGRVRCRRCRMDAVANWRRRTKAKLVKEAGGQCVICGYNRHQSALHFHHLDPKQKKFHLAESGVTRSIESLRREVAKCALLCSNCHAEVEVGFTKL
jgi:transposase